MGDTRRHKLPVILAILAAAVGFAAPAAASFTTLAPNPPTPPAPPSLTASVETPIPSLGERLPPALTPTGPRPYFGARYYGSKIGRFTTVDPYLDQSTALVDPQRWNRYAYARNNPLRYVDPDGRAIETPWDALNVGIGVASLVGNVAGGNIGGAALDAAGLVYDVAATAVPGLPGGAGTLIKAARGADRLADVVKAGDKVADVAKAARGGETAATKAGREAHRTFAEKVRGKADEGWQSEPTIKGPHGETLRPDAISPSGRPVELKPNTPSGHRRGGAQLKKYEEATGKKGRVVTYDK